jgi:hypothetical protein
MFALTYPKLSRIDDTSFLCGLQNLFYIRLICIYHVNITALHGRVDGNASLKQIGIVFSQLN